MAKHPIDRLQAAAFGPFADIDVAFSPSLNVIVGDNATGKSHMLKLLYSATSVLRDSDEPSKRDLNRALADKLIGTFRPDSLGRIARRTRGRSRCEVTLKLGRISTPLSFSFSTHARTDVNVGDVPNKNLHEDQPVFVPAHELLSLGAAFLELYDMYETPFDETWRDTVKLLLRPALRGPRGEKASELIEPFSELVSGGKVTEHNGRFALSHPGIGNLEAPLLAEGHRKIAMIMRLISSGVLLESGYLFWDEPEANLNPSSQRAVANALTHLARHGVQIFAATHSTFLLREIEMAVAAAPKIDPQYIGLGRVSTEDGSAAPRVLAASAVDIDNLPAVTSLDAEVAQADRYLGASL